MFRCSLDSLKSPLEAVKFRPPGQVTDGYKNKESLSFKVYVCLYLNLNVKTQKLLLIARALLAKATSDRNQLTHQLTHKLIRA